MFMKLRKVKNCWLTLHEKTGFFNINIRNKWKCISLSFYFMIGFLWGWHLHKYFFDVVRNKLETINIYTRVDKNSRNEYVIRTCFRFWPIKNIFRKLWANESLIMACVQIYRELFSLATFLRVHSNSKEMFYLYWQNRCPNLKTTCHIKLKPFFWTKLLESILLQKYLISVAVTLTSKFHFRKICKSAL